MLISNVPPTSASLFWFYYSSKKYYFHAFYLNFAVSDIDGTSAAKLKEMNEIMHQKKTVVIVIYFYELKNPFFPIQ